MVINQEYVAKQPIHLKCVEGKGKRDAFTIADAATGVNNCPPMHDGTACAAQLHTRPTIITSIMLVTNKSNDNTHLFSTHAASGICRMTASARVEAWACNILSLCAHSVAQSGCTGVHKPQTRHVVRGVATQTLRWRCVAHRLMFENVVQVTSCSNCPAVRCQCTTTKRWRTRMAGQSLSCAQSSCPCASPSASIGLGARCGVTKAESVNLRSCNCTCGVSVCVQALQRKHVHAA